MVSPPLCWPRSTSRNIDRVAVVGLSMGGYLAFALWRLAPERIRALVLCNTRATADSDSTPK